MTKTTETTTGKTMVTGIPFEGFYETWSDDKIEDMAGLSERYFEYWSDENPQREEETKTNGFATWKIPAETNEEYIQRRDDDFDAIRDTTDYNNLRNEFAAGYVERFADDNSIELKYESLTSPKEYNFTTDRIFAYITKAEVLRLYNSLDQDKLDELIKEKFTSYDGFMSHYTPDQHQWGPVETWDHNQVETIIECAIVDNISDDGLGWYIANLMEDFYR